MDKKVSVKIPVETLEKLRHIKKQTGIPISFAVKTAVDKVYKK